MRDEALAERFLFDRGWSGGDGIFTFNLTNGRDAFNQKEPSTTLFVFGDTFVGTSDAKTKKRLQPHLMPNNSLAYMDKEGRLDFKLNWQEDGAIGNFYNIDPAYDLTGTIAYNLVNYDRKEAHPGWLSGFHPETIEIIFDLHKPRPVSRITFENYFSDELAHLNKRGIKSCQLMGSNDCLTWTKIGEYVLEKSKRKGDQQTIDVKAHHRCLKLVIDARPGIGNHNDDEFQEGLFGLDGIAFYHDKERYRDVFPYANTTLLKNRAHSWIWLQDGVVIGDHLYFIPIIINSDKTQPEGLQFKVLGAALFKTPIKDEQVLTHESSQKMAPLLLDHKGSNYLFGCALMNNTKEAGAPDPDGYIYIYGYKTTMGLRELLLARVKPEDFECFDDWRYYDGQHWSPELLDAKPLLPHISCEMSVSPLGGGSFKGKYLAVFTYDTNTPYVAYALGDTPFGPFTDPQKIYHTPEQAVFKSTTYTYNAKAHPHLSASDNILVSYNTNTYNYEHNMSDHRVYRARFIWLKDTGA